MRPHGAIFALWACLVACLLAVLPGLAVADDVPDGVIELNKSNFNSRVLSSKEISVVLFTAEAKDCPPCVTMLKEAGDAAKELNKYGIVTGVLDISKYRDSKAGQKFLKEINVPGAPLVLVYHGESTPNPYGGRPMRASTMVKGSDARSIKREAMKAMPQLVKRVESADSQAYKAAMTEVKSEYVVVALTERPKTSPMLQSLAFALEGQVAVVEVHASVGAGDDEDEESDGQADGVAALFPKAKGGLPALYVLKKINSKVGTGKPAGGEGGAMQFVEGDLKDRQAVLEFIAQETGIDLSGPKAVEGGEGEEGAAATEGDDAGGEEGGTVQEDYVVLSAADLQKKVRYGKEALVVAVVPSLKDDLGTLVPGWGQSVPPLAGGGGQLLVGVVDCEANGQTQQEGTAESGSGLAALCAQVKNDGKPVLRVYAHAMSDLDSRDDPRNFKAEELKKALTVAESSLPDNTLLYVPAGQMSPDALQQAMQQLVSQRIMAPRARADATKSKLRDGGDDDGEDDEDDGDAAAAIVDDAPRMILVVTSAKEQPSLLIKSLAAEFSDGEGKATASTPPAVTVVYFAKPPVQFLERSGLGSKIPSVHLLFTYPGAVREGAGLDADGNPLMEVQLTSASYSSRIDGPITHRNLKKWILSHQSMLRQLHTAADDAEAKTTSAASADFSEADRSVEEAEAAAVTEVTAENWGTLCSKDSAQICAVAVLSRAMSPGAVDNGGGDELDSTIELLQTLATRARQRKGAFSKKGIKHGAVPPLKVMWVDGLCQQAFASGFEVQPDSLPGLFIYSPKRQRFAKFVGAFDSANVEGWLSDVLQSKVSTSQVYQEPELEQIDCAMFDSSAAAAALGAVAEQEEDGLEMDDLLAEIRAEEERAKKEMQEEVARAMKQAAQEAADAASTGAKKKKKKKKKKKSATGEL